MMAMMRTYDKTGMRYSRLLVLRKCEPISGRTAWLCQCDCGTVKPIMGQSLASGTTVSCGCFGLEKRREKGKNVTHGKSSGSRAYQCWREMKKRCLTKTCHAYNRYGGRGIKICDRWMSFENFLEDMGEPSPGQSLDRVDNSGNYEPGNCRWANDIEQARNRRNVKSATYMGRKLIIPEIAEISGRKYSTVYYHFRRNPNADLANFL